MLGERFNQLHQSHCSKHHCLRANQQNKDLSTHSTHLSTSHEMQEQSSLAVSQYQHVLNLHQERDDVLQQ